LPKLPFWLENRLRRERNLIERLAALACLALLLALRVLDPAPIEAIRLKSLDFYQWLQPRQTAAPVVTIVDIDEESQKELGQWPWPRSLIAEMVRQATRLGAVAIAFDAVFPEPDRMSPAGIARLLPNLEPALAERLDALPSNDQVLAEALRSSRTVLGQSGFERPKSGQEQALKTAPLAEIGGDPRPHLVSFPGLVRNIGELEQAAHGLGLMTLNPEPDGIVRRVPAVARIGRNLFPTLSIELLRVATGGSAMAIKTEPHGIKSVVVGGVEIPTDRKGRLWVHFAPHDPARYVSAKELIAGAAPAERFRGRLVLVGTSAIGLRDIKATPLLTSMPGVEVHAQLLETILAKSYLLRPNNAIGAELVVTGLLGLLLIVFVPNWGPLRSLAAGFIAAAALAGAAWYLYAEHRQLYDVVYPAAATLLIYGILAYLNYIREAAAKRQVRSAFSRYISPALVDRLADHPEQLKLGGETRELTLLFCDIRGFTTISEQYDAEGLTQLINRFLTPMTEIILENQGTIDKYMGDAIMAFWNAPMDDPEHAEHACRTALKMIPRLTELNLEWRAEAEAEGETYLPINIGIGLNTGRCVVGNMGSEQRFDYSVLGDDVNLASRLEGQTKTYGVDIIIGENTQRLVPDLATLELDVVKVKGKTKPSRIYALLGDEALAQAPEFQALVALNQSMLEGFRRSETESVRALIEECRGLADGKLKGFYDYCAVRIERGMGAPADQPEAGL